MESQPQNPEFRINPENFHCICTVNGLPVTVQICSMIIYTLGN